MNIVEKLEAKKVPVKLYRIIVKRGIHTFKSEGYYESVEEFLKENPTYKLSNPRKVVRDLKDWKFKEQTK